jgi:hypothetical protein
MKKQKTLEQTAGPSTAPLAIGLQETPLRMTPFFYQSDKRRLAAVVGGGFGVDEETADFGAVEFEGAFEGGDDVVNLGHGEVVGEGAVAVDLDAVVDAGDEDVVDVEDLGKGLGSAA